MNRIINYSLNNRLIIGLLTLVLIAWGVYNYLRLPIDAVPDITNNQVQVITISPSLAPQEVEQFITFPVEVNLANIQDVTEIRSISRSGLSVVTIVFKDQVDPWLARQMVNEQLQVAKSEIPEGYGEPQMMPVTTGLGEIYQYVLEPEPGYESVYDAMTLRTIHDWIVKRYLSGIPGIVEVSSFGGYLKQYEVSINPRTLVAMNLSLIEIFNALEKNNQNTGGGYIEKGPNAIYIRAQGMIQSEEDIRNIIIREVNGMPLLIGDVAEVGIGSPPRYGAMTRNGKGETVGGITLMLRGANTASVIDDVKQRIELLQEILPEGLHIHPYLDRSVLIRKTIRTVAKNLIEGGLIVILVLILLLGNWRAGVIVASVIPLSMLFAFSMMNLFGVSANLMSLGAIDFGLIVDGSVIMVEGIIHRLEQNRKKGLLPKGEMKNQILVAGQRVSRSALFGVLIILIVYLPILAFTGIEGKTFRPMAQTVIFALVGALILSVTYVPVMASLLLNRPVHGKEGFSARIINFLHRRHEPVLKLALRYRWTTVVLATLLVIVSFIAFSRMGAEFIPTLEEGDLAAQMTLAPGSSLKESIASSTRAEQILLEEFPEVKEVVSKIGTAEIPTDPMAIEDADMMILLKPKEEWVTARTREELVEKMKEALSVLPGLSFEFQQPIQLRFNELMTGVKSDVAVKIYGEDLELLYEKALEAAAWINDIPGAGDVKVEQVVGLPQMIVNYKRDQLARYGLSVNDINEVVNMAFAGKSAGVVFEGEKRFDLVVRLCDTCRSNLQSLRNLQINPPRGSLITLSQVADIEYKEGPMQISRDNTRRRITIGINIRNRDVESFVKDVDQILSERLSLPPGYYVTYGGQFENLQQAKRTSGIAVPIALLAIMVLLYFTFYSVRQSLMIFTAIPLAAVGGIWSLYLRGMPFSISAGVGFIALFGVAVLNGIVLISYFNHLKDEGGEDPVSRVLNGTRMRLRPVIMTATVAALGFIPMALSTAPGAEVQKPLATVVIGGLITSTFLTLVVLPVIYVHFSGNEKKTKGNRLPLSPLIALFITASVLFIPRPGQAQEKGFTIDKAVAAALENNRLLQNEQLSVEQAGLAKKKTLTLTPLEVDYQYGQINSSYKDQWFNIRQQFELPNVYINRHKALNNEEQRSKVWFELQKRRLVYGVKQAYIRWFYAFKRKEMLGRQDSLLHLLVQADSLRIISGDISSLVAMTNEALYQDLQKRYVEAWSTFAEYEAELKSATGLQRLEAPPGDWLILDRAVIPLSDSALPETYETRYAAASIQASEAQLKNIKSSRWPGFYLGYFQQSIDLQPGFRGIQAGAAIPIWFWSSEAEVKIRKIELAKKQNLLENVKKQNQDRISALAATVNELSARWNAMLQTSNLSADDYLISLRNAMDAGEINLSEYIRGVRLAFDAQMARLDVAEAYNLAVAELNYYLTID